MSVRVRATRPVIPGYGVPEGAGEARSWSWGEEMLREGHNYWLATTRPEGRPHVMPIWGVWHDGAFWFSTGARSRKAKNLALRAECAIGSERAGEAVILEGAAVRCAAAEAPADIARLYLAKYGMGFPDDSPLFRVGPRVVFGFSEAADEFGEAATRWLFEEA